MDSTASDTASRQKMELVKSRLLCKDVGRQRVALDLIATQSKLKELRKIMKAKLECAQKKFDESKKLKDSLLCNLPTSSGSSEPVSCFSVQAVSSTIQIAIDDYTKQVDDYTEQIKIIGTRLGLEKNGSREDNIIMKRCLRDHADNQSRSTYEKELKEGIDKIIAKYDEIKKIEPKKAKKFVNRGLKEQVHQALNDGSFLRRTKKRAEAVRFLAKQLKVSERTIYMWAAGKRLKAVGAPRMLSSKTANKALTKYIEDRNAKGEGETGSLPMIDQEKH